MDTVVEDTVGGCADVQMETCDETVAEGSQDGADETNGGMDSDEVELARKLKEWVKEQLDKEVARVEACGQKITRLSVKNCSVVRPATGNVINRVEVDSSMDFDTVQQILLSDPVAVPIEEKKGFSMCFVVLSTGKPSVRILPYIFDTSIANNTLKEWSLINSNLKSSHHRIKGFED